LEAATRTLEASTELDLPPRSWAAITDAVSRIAEHLFPAQTVALRLVDDAEMRRLNKAFRNVDDSTDVLAFPLAEGGMHGHAGDIALCWPAALRQAGANGNTPEAEATALAAHGLLHLAGLDHSDEPSQDEMDRRTRELCHLAQIEVVHVGH
jgi:probable rRNA maturation factor